MSKPSSSFRMPSEYDGFVSSAETLLDQFKQVAPLDFMIYKIYPETEWTIADAIKFRLMILDILEPLLHNYIWHKDTFQPKVILPADGELVYLGGTLEFGDNVEDEWFVVFLLYELTIRFSTLSVSISDMDGEFLLFEAAAHIPDWLGPDNCENRVWLKKGKLHIIEIDHAPSTRSGGISLKNALEVLQTNQHTCANSGAQMILRNRMQGFPAKITAHKHSAVCAVPKKIAELLAARPQLISSAVGGLGSERDKSYMRSMSSMGFFGATDTVLVPVTFTRALYAQLTFQQRFHPPPRFHSAQRKLQQKGWDRATAKAFDVGSRVACGLEIAYQKSRTLEGDGEISAARQDRLVKVTKELANRKATLQSGVDVSDFVVLSSPLSSNAMAESGDPFILEAFKTHVPLHEEINRVLNYASRDITALPPTIEEVSPLLSESDEWLHYTPDEFDRNIEMRIKRLSVETVDDPVEHHSEVEGDATPASDPSPLPYAKEETDTDTRILNELVHGMDKFMQTSSALGGVGDAEGADTADDPEDEDEDIDDHYTSLSRSSWPSECKTINDLSPTEIATGHEQDSDDDVDIEPLWGSSANKWTPGSPPTEAERNVFPDTSSVEIDDQSAATAVVEKIEIPCESPEDAIASVVSGPLNCDTSPVLSMEKECDTNTASEAPSPIVEPIDVPILDSGETALNLSVDSRAISNVIEFDAAVVASLIENVSGCRLQAEAQAQKCHLSVALAAKSPLTASSPESDALSHQNTDTRKGKKEIDIPPAPATAVVLQVDENKGVILPPDCSSAATTSAALSADSMQRTVAVIEDEFLVGRVHDSPPLHPAETDVTMIQTISSPVAHALHLVRADKAVTDSINFDFADVQSILGGDTRESSTNRSETAELAGAGQMELSMAAKDVRKVNETALVEDEARISPSRNSRVPVVQNIQGMNPVLTNESDSDLKLGEVLVDVLSELTRLGLFDTPPDVECDAICKGELCVDTCRKLGGLQNCVETKGTEKEWHEAFTRNDCAILQYLFLLMHSEVHAVLQDGASRCLAHGYVACPLLWTYYAPYAQSPHYSYVILECAVQRVRDLSHPPGSGGAPEGAEVDGDVKPQTAVSIWLLVLFQLFRSPVLLLNAEFRRWRLKRNTGSGAGAITTDRFLELVAELLYLTCGMDSAPFSVCMKALVAINWQIPLRYSLESTEISDLCARLFYIENVPGLQLHQGLINMINDIGYPNHTAPETLPCLRFSYNLIMVPDYNGFFCTNDVEILSHIVIREVDNMSADTVECNMEAADDEEVFESLNGPVKATRANVPSYSELVRHMYVRLGSALLSRSKWAQVTTAISKSDIMMEMIDKSNERLKATKHKQSFNTTIPAGADKKSLMASTSIAYSARHTSLSCTAHAGRTDDDSKVSDISDKTTIPTASRSNRSPKETLSTGMEKFSANDQKVSENWTRTQKKQKSSADGDSKSTNMCVEAVRTFIVGSGEEDVVVSMEEYMSAMDSELSGTTMHETFERQGDGRQKSGDGDEFYEVDVEKNLLKNLLESHAGQMGGAGPASNILSQMGVELPKPPHLSEE